MSFPNNSDLNIEWESVFETLAENETKKRKREKEKERYQNMPKEDKEKILQEKKYNYHIDTLLNDNKEDVLEKQRNKYASMSQEKKEIIL